MDRTVIAGDFGRCRLLGNAHTFPGLMAAETEDGVGVSLSKSDITDASAEVWAWIDGFLAGNEPTLADFLGVDLIEAVAIDDEDDRISRWRDAMSVFRSKGTLPFALYARPTEPPPPEVDADWVWALAGGQVLKWRSTAWLPADPQPELKFALKAGTICAEREHCNLELVGQRYLTCVDCGHLQQYWGGRP